MNQAQTKEFKQEQVIHGIVGALLFSLAGGIVWFLLYMAGFLAAISGLIGVVCAIKGYALFAGKESMKGVIISSVIAVLILVLAWYLCIGYDIYIAYQDWYEAGDVDFTLTFFESVSAIPYFFIEDSSILIDYLMNLGLGLLFAVIGAFGSVRNAIARIKAQNAQPVVNSEMEEAPEVSSDIEAEVEKTEEQEEVKH